MTPFNNPRATAASILWDILEEGVFLSQITTKAMPEKPMVLQLCYGTLRHYYELSYLLKQLMPKPIRTKERVIHFLLLIGLYQLRYLRVPLHAAVTETVNAVSALKKPWAKALVNGVLREYLRCQSDLVLPSDEEITFNHPVWLIELIKAAWPSHWQDILTANQQQAPLTLRVNQQKITRDDYLQQLAQHDILAHAHPYVTSAIELETPCPVDQLPGFQQSLVSVQDAAAQQCGFVLPVAAQSRVLDACCAPGGKTGHLLEQHPSLELIALDVSESRQKRTQENLTRLNLNARLFVADAADVDAWWDQKNFDAILLDAPCSATGVIRRHPDIKLLRELEDFSILPTLQLSLLEKLWPLLNPEGHLLYATCSIIPLENDSVIHSFITTHPDAEVIPLALPPGEKTPYGWQRLPGQANMDGFYYSLLRKK